MLAVSTIAGRSGQTGESAMEAPVWIVPRGGLRSSITSGIVRVETKRSGDLEYDEATLEAVAY
jgi:hypothetical protein